MVNILLRCSNTDGQFFNILIILYSFTTMSFRKKNIFLLVIENDRIRIKINDNVCDR